MAVNKKAAKAPGVTFDQEYELVPVGGDTDRLKEHPRNPRRGVVEAIDESVEVNGWYGAVIAQKSTGYILAGNHRYRVALSRGATEVPTIWRDVDDETALRILLADNKTADLGVYDEETLTALLDELGDLKGTGYNLENVMAEVAADEEGSGDAPEGDEEPEVPDDVYQPQYGVMIVVGSEEQQEALYEWINDCVQEGLEVQNGVHIFEGVKLRVVAV